MTARCARCGQVVDPHSSRVLHSHEGRYFHGYDVDCKPREYGTEMTYMGYSPAYERPVRRPLLIIASPRTVKA